MMQSTNTLHQQRNLKGLTAKQLVTTSEYLSTYVQVTAPVSSDQPGGDLT